MPRGGYLAERASRGLPDAFGFGSALPASFSSYIPGALSPTADAWTAWWRCRLDLVFIRILFVLITAVASYELHPLGLNRWPAAGEAGCCRRPAGGGRRAGRRAVRGRPYRRRRITRGRGRPAADRLHAAVAEELRYHQLWFERQAGPDRRHPRGARDLRRHGRGGGFPPAVLRHGRGGGVRGHRAGRRRYPSHRELH